MKTLRGVTMGKMPKCSGMGEAIVRAQPVSDYSEYPTFSSVRILRGCVCHWSKLLKLRGSHISGQSMRMEPGYPPSNTSQEVVANSDAKNGNSDRRGFEALAVILLSLATVGMAWCSYQATVWAAESTQLSMQSVARGSDASDLRIKANQAFILDIILFSQYLNAHNASNEPLAEFYARQFSPEFKQTYEAQIRSSKLTNVPTDLFTKDLYQSPLLARADRLESESERMWYNSIEAATAGQQYTLISVLLATALFFSGTAPQFERPRKRRIVLTLGLAALLTAFGMFITLPKPSAGRTPSSKATPEVTR